MGCFSEIEFVLLFPPVEAYLFFIDFH